MRNRLLIVMMVVLLGGTTQLLAQRGTGRVAGTVRDTDGNPIKGAKVTAQESGSDFVLEAVTDEEGRWAILGFRSGTYTFTFSAEGYQQQVSTVSVNQLGRNPSMRVELEGIQEAFANSATGTLLGEAIELQEQKKYGEALAKYEEIVAADPSLYEVHVNIGNLYRDMGELDKALAEYELVLQKEPGHAIALVSAGDVLVKQDKLDEAREFFEKAIVQVPDDEVLPFNVAEIYFKAGNTDKAIEYYQRAIEIKPDWPEPYLKLGYAYLNSGNIDGAVGAFQKVVEVAPDSPQAQMAKSALESLQKN